MNCGQIIELQSNSIDAIKISGAKDKYVRNYNSEKLVSRDGRP